MLVKVFDGRVRLCFLSYPCGRGTLYLLKVRLGIVRAIVGTPMESLRVLPALSVVLDGLDDCGRDACL